MREAAKITGENISSSHSTRCGIIVHTFIWQSAPNAWATAGEYTPWLDPRISQAEHKLYNSFIHSFIHSFIASDAVKKLLCEAVIFSYKMRFRIVYANIVLSTSCSLNKRGRRSTSAYSKSYPILFDITKFENILVIFFNMIFCCILHAKIAIWKIWPLKRQSFCLMSKTLLAPYDCKNWFYTAPIFF